MVQPPPPSPTAEQNKTYMHNCDPVDEDGQVRCYTHGEVVRRLTSFTDKNYNRDFYRCQAPGCKFFKWADDVDPIIAKRMAALEKQSPSMSHAAQAQSTPETPRRPSQRERAALARTPSTPVSPSKHARPVTPPPVRNLMIPASQRPEPRTPVRPARVRAAVTPSSALTPSQRERRMEAINAGLALRPESPENGAHPSSRLADGPGASQEYAAASSHGSTSREAATRAGRVVWQAQSQAHLDSFELSYSPFPKRSRLEDYDPGSEPASPQPSLYSAGIQTSPILSTADRMSECSSAYVTKLLLDEPDVFSPSPQRAGSSHSSRYDTAPSTPLQLPEVLTAPFTPRTPRPMVASQIHAFTPSNSRSHGLPTPPQSSPLGPDLDLSSSQDSMYPPDSPTRWKGKGRDLGTPASQWERIQADPENPFHERAVALRSRSQDTDRSHGLNQPQDGGQALADALSADSIAIHVECLSGVPEYVRKLERKQVAAQKSIEIKSKRIVDLEQENEQLKARNRVLEETVEALRARR